MSERDLLALSTLPAQGRFAAPDAAPWPCLTIVWHPDLSRLGERSILRQLSLGHPAFVSRSEPLFAASTGPTPRPLLDARVSRTALRLHPAPGGLELQADGVSLRIDGAVGPARHVISHEAIARGVVLDLSGILVLLHQTRGTTATAAPEFVGDSDAIRQLSTEVDRVASFDVPVLLCGETGVGKERAALAIHRKSPRASGPFVSVNMATISASTGVSSLFGHAKGAFTGAVARHRGLFDHASGGTLLLDEVGETSPEVQPMLLRAIETGRILPLGAEADHAVDVRIVAATDSPVRADGSAFKRALLHRLSGYEIQVPPLRERREDIPSLLVHFAREALGADRSRAPALESIPLPFLVRLLRHPLPGNVRQLKNVAQALVISNRGCASMAVTDVAERALGADVPHVEAAADDGGRKRVQQLTEEEISAALRETSWSPTRAAARLGIPTATFHDLMRRSPSLRRARDLRDDELRAALSGSAGDISTAARNLRVSERALKLTLRGRGLSEV
jgi:two-component system nitrogen regulation response regulator GlnG